MIFKALKTVGLFSSILLGLLSIIATSGDEIEETSQPAATSGTNTLPTATINTPADGSTFLDGDLVTFSGAGEDAEDGTLTGGALVWSSSIDGRIGIGAQVSNIPLSTGTHVVTLTATDSDGGIGSATTTLTVNPRGNTIPTAAITAPSDGATFAQGHLVTFSGTGTDAEDGDLTGTALVWSSQTDGQIGVGKTFTTSTLSVGTHTIALAVTDSANTTGTTSVSIIVGNTPPVATINYPATGATLNENESVTFSGTGTDPEDGTLNGNALVWRSSKDGQIGIGISPTVDYLSSGTHSITLTVTDSDGATDTDIITVTVGNTSPTPAISNPSDGDIYNQNNLIVFNGSATDTEDGNLYGASLVWTSNIDGLIGTGTSFTISGVSTGQHLITLTATDRNGAAASTTINITVE